MLRPDWTKTVLARRVAAGGLVVLAALAALRSDPAGDYAEVLPEPLDELLADSRLSVR